MNSAGMPRCHSGSGVVSAVGFKARITSSHYARDTEGTGETRRLVRLTQQRQARLRFGNCHPRESRTEDD